MAYPLFPDEAYNLLEIIEARCTHGSTFFVHSLKPMVGIGASIPTRKMTVQFQKQLWTELLTTLITFSLTVKNPCENGMVLLQRVRNYRLLQDGLLNGSHGSVPPTEV